MNVMEPVAPAVYWLPAAPTAEYQHRFLRWNGVRIDDFLILRPRSNRLCTTVAEREQPQNSSSSGSRVQTVRRLSAYG